MRTKRSDRVNFAGAATPRSSMSILKLSRAICLASTFHSVSSFFIGSLTGAVDDCGLDDARIVQSAVFIPLDVRDAIFALDRADDDCLT